MFYPCIRDIPSQTLSGAILTLGAGVVVHTVALREVFLRVHCSSFASKNPPMLHIHSLFSYHWQYIIFVIYSAFYALLTVHLSIILVINQLNAQILLL